MPATIISEGIVQTFCRPGRQSGTCRYLVKHLLGLGWACAKTDPSLVPQIQARIDSGTFHATGDNCSGPPDFKPFDKRPIARHDLPASMYPFTIEALSLAGEVVWSKTVERPAGEVAIEIPGLKQQLGFPVSIRCRFADGSVREYPPQPESSIQ